MEVVFTWIESPPDISDDMDDYQLQAWVYYIISLIYISLTGLFSVTDSLQLFTA